MRRRITKPTLHFGARVLGLQLVAQEQLSLDIVRGNISDLADNFINDWFLARAAGRHGVEIYRAGGPSKRVGLVAGKLAPELAPDSEGRASIGRGDDRSCVAEVPGK
jgi:hypothetical protein